MKLTQEQEEIVRSSDNIKVNAVAGSGKTTTIIEYAKQKASSGSLLYIAFNKSVKMEAVQKFAAAGLQNVRVETAHSLAFKSIVAGSGYRVRATYQTLEVVKILGIGKQGDFLHVMSIAKHILSFVAYFCNSQCRKVQELNYCDTLSDEAAISFVSTHYELIEYYTRLFLAKMDSGEIEITHDFYLKKYQLSNPTLLQKYILFDEGQDASAAMLDVFLKQKSTKLIVGDTHQQIYRWRYAVNSLESVDFKGLNLSSSFRFNGDVACLAQNILQLKSHLEPHFVPPYIDGLGGGKGLLKSHGYVARTNISLIDKAIELVVDKRKVGKLYFEGNINSYTYGDEGTSLLDIIYLQRGVKEKVRDSLIASFNDIYELEEYVENTDDMQLKAMLEMVNKYGHELPSLINKIKSIHVEDANKMDADVIFSTVHRCKGMEYDEVTLASDFMTEDKLRREFAINPNRAAELAEEVNLLYVAATRAKVRLNIPTDLRLVDFAVSETGSVRAVGKRDRVLSMEEKRSAEKGRKDQKERPASSHTSWRPDDDKKLVELYDRGWSVDEIADFFSRSKVAIKSRLKKFDIF